MKTEWINSEECHDMEAVVIRRGKESPGIVYFYEYHTGVCGKFGNPTYQWANEDLFQQYVEWVMEHGEFSEVTYDEFRNAWNSIGATKYRLTEMWKRFVSKSHANRFPGEHDEARDAYNTVLWILSNEYTFAS